MAAAFRILTDSLSFLIFEPWLIKIKALFKHLQNYICFFDFRQRVDAIDISLFPIPGSVSLP